MSVTYAAGVPISATKRTHVCCTILPGISGPVGNHSKWCSGNLSLTSL